MKILNKKGFTLLELLIVILIISILAAIAVPQYQKAVNKSRLAEAVLFSKNLENTVRYLANKDVSGQGKEIADFFNLKGASWDEAGLKYSTHIHSLDVSCQDSECVLNVYYPKTGTPVYTLTFTAQKDQEVSKTCQGPDYICNSLTDKGFTQI